MRGKDMNIDTVIFLGAGASKTDGAPLQGDLFYDYFSSNNFKESHDEMDRELATFFDAIFNIDVDDPERLKNAKFPTFEEVLGIIDLGLIRKESFKDYDLENRAANSGRLRAIGRHLVFLMAKILEIKLQTTKNIHKKLVNNLISSRDLTNTAFLTTNYDILIDNALTEKYDYVDLNYGIEFRNFERKNDWRRPKLKKSVYLLKLHGSLNWLHCPTCNEIEITPKEKAVATRLIFDFKNSSCPICGTIYSPIIVPPTFYKEMNNIFLAQTWNLAEKALRKTKHLVFSGYSFPDADMHIKYLIKRGQINRQTNLKITVVNHFIGKKDCEEEKKRFCRFLGNSINYTQVSFEQFAKDPRSVLIE